MASTLIFRIKDYSSTECPEVDNSFWLCESSIQIPVKADLVIVDLEDSTVAIQVKYETFFFPSFSLLRLIHASYAYATSVEGNVLTASFELKLGTPEIHRFDRDKYHFIKAQVDLAPVDNFADIVRSMEPAFNCRHYSGRLGVLKCEVNPGVACRECLRYEAALEKTL